MTAEQASRIAELDVRLRKLAIRDNQPQITQRLFSGRLSISDTITLGSYFDSAFRLQPRYDPPGARDVRRLAALLAYSSNMMKADLELVTRDGVAAAANRTEIW